MFCFSWILDIWSSFLLVRLSVPLVYGKGTFVAIFSLFSYTPVNQIDPTGKFMNLVIAHCVIAQVRYMVSWHMVFEVVACLLSRVYILVLFGSGWAYYNCQFRRWYSSVMEVISVSYWSDIRQLWKWYIHNLVIRDWLYLFNFQLFVLYLVCLVYTFVWATSCVHFAFHFPFCSFACLVLLSLLNLNFYLVCMTIGHIDN